MAKAESYNDLIFQLADLARERLAERPNAPRSIDRVFRAEEVLLARRDELAELEGRMNEEDAAYRDFLAERKSEREGLQRTVKQWKKAVDAIDGRVRELRKRVASKRADLRYGEAAFKKEEQKHADLELTSQDARKLDVSRENLKKLRLSHMRQQRDLEELERELDQVLTPKPGQPGSEGILAHKRLLEIEDEAALRKEAFDRSMSELDQAIAQKEEEVRAAEEYLDQALFLFGEECYTLRVSDPMLAALYPRIDGAA